MKHLKSLFGAVTVMLLLLSTFSMTPLVTKAETKVTKIEVGHLTNDAVLTVNEFKAELESPTTLVEKMDTFISLFTIDKAVLVTSKGLVLPNKPNRQVSHNKYNRYKEAKITIYNKKFASTYAHKGRISKVLLT